MAHRAPRQQGPPWDTSEKLSSRGADPNLNLRIHSPSHALLSTVDASAADLVRIASYVYASDQAVSRGGEADAFDDDWERDFTLCVPVSDPDFWHGKEVLAGLVETLRFLSGDRWFFEFTKTAPEEDQLSLDFDPAMTLGEPDSLFLWSGGLGSLCAVLEAFTHENKRPLLVGHSSAFHLAALQRNLASAVAGEFPKGWRFPYLSVVPTSGRDGRQRHC